MSRTTMQEIGTQAENWALEYLKKQGLSLVARNFYCHRGEIDLILKDGEELVFVEVRYRQQKGFGSGIETVDGAKQRKIISSAEHYLYSQKIWDHPCRFDVIGISVDIKQRVEVTWEKNAFFGNYYI